MFELQLLEARDRRVEAIWRMLEASASASYFLSWGWIENWLACLPQDALPRLAVLHDHDVPVAAYFLARRTSWRHGALPSRALYLNATGDPCHDGLRVEHNDILRASGSRVTLETMVERLPPGWDELYLPAVDGSAFPELNRLTDRAAYRVLIDRELSAPYVDLETVRAVPGGYLSVLSSSMRAQIRCTQRDLGELRLEIADDERQAIDSYLELVQLHARRWHMRGERGAFGEPFFDQFHRRLIAQRLRHGEIQLMRIVAGTRTVGCLYVLVHRGRALFYQSGLSQFSDPHIKPGYVCHAMAVEHYAAAGLQIYDLLGGNARYVQSLATGETRLLWLRVQRKLARFMVEERLRGLKRAVTGWRQRGLAPGVSTQV